MSSSSSWAGYGTAAPAPSVAPSSSTQLQRSGSGDRQSKKPQSRQLLSCTKCRERKVKCDRTKPCSACCARGHPKECEFVVGEGNDYSPIQQSYEIRKLRAENQRLKERLQAARLSPTGDDDDDGRDDGSKAAASRARQTQRRFKMGERADNLYFGTPGLANIVADFASLSLSPTGASNHSLTHPLPLPRGRDIYSPPNTPSAYPFPILWSSTTSNKASDLARSLLNSPTLVSNALDHFQQRAQSCYFPHVPDEVTKKEVERFMADLEGNAEKFPDMLALIFATVATGMQMGVWDEGGGSWEVGEVERTRGISDVYLAASMQALRLASFMNTPTLLGIQTLIMIGPYLTNSGRFLDAWTLFGTTIRLAQSIGLHRDPKFLDPVPPLREATIRRTLWWWMLHMDQQYSVTLGRPLGISGIGDCPPPEPLTTNPTILRLGEFVDHFTILSRQILTSDGMMNVGRIDEFTDKLLGLWDTMPEALQFNESWLQPTTNLPDWPLEVMSATLFAKVQSLLILLNRQRVERTQTIPVPTPTDHHHHHSHSHSPPGYMGPPARPYHQQQQQTTYSDAQIQLHPSPLRGRPLVINSSIHLLQTFMFFWYRSPSVLICWTMSQQAFNAAIILILDAWETDNMANVWMVEHAFAAFNELATKGVHKLAELAVGRLSCGLAVLGERESERERMRREHEQQQQVGGIGGGLGVQLQIDTASMSDLAAAGADTVMGNTGMFLLEDPGLQSYVAPAFQPLTWNIAGGGGGGGGSAGGSAHPSNHSPSNPTTPNIPSPIIPVSKVTAAPFPVMTSPFEMVGTSSGGGMLPVTTTYGLSGMSTAFTPINTGDMGVLQQQAFPQMRGPPARHPQGGGGSGGGGAGPARGGVQHHSHHRAGARSQQRRK